MGEEILKKARDLLSERDFEAFGGELWLRAAKIMEKAKISGLEAAIATELVILRRQNRNLANRDQGRPWRRLSTHSEMEQIDPRRVKRKW